MKSLACLALLLMVACSREEGGRLARPGGRDARPPTADDARKVIQSSMEFGEYEFTDVSYTLPVAGSMMNEPQRAAARDLALAGWLTIEHSGDATLTEKARNDKRFLMRANGLLDIVPLAKKEMGNVVAVRANPDGTVSADFTWRWIANDVATEWIVLKIP